MKLCRFPGCPEKGWLAHYCRRHYKPNRDDVLRVEVTPLEPLHGERGALLVETIDGVTTAWERRTEEPTG